MTITRLKAKNQLTIPQKIVKMLKLRKDELFEVRVERNRIVLIPLELEPNYTPEELAKINKIVEREKSTAKMLKVGEEFSRYIDTL